MPLPDLLRHVRDELKDPARTDEDIIRALSAGLLAAAATVLLPPLEAMSTVTVPAGAASVSLPPDFHRNLFSALDHEGRTLGVSRSLAPLEPLLRAGPQRDVRCVCTIDGRHLRVAPVPTVETAITLGYYRRPNPLVRASGRASFFRDAHAVVTDLPCFSGLAPGDRVHVSGSASNDGEKTLTAVTDASVSVTEEVVEEGPVRIQVAFDDVEGVPAHLEADVVGAYALARLYGAVEDAMEGKSNAGFYRSVYEQSLAMLRLHFQRHGMLSSVRSTGEMSFEGWG